MALQADGTTPLFVACQKGHVTVVTALLDHGASTALATVCAKPWATSAQRNLSLVGSHGNNVHVSMTLALRPILHGFGSS